VHPYFAQLIAYVALLLIFWVLSAIVAFAAAELTRHRSMLRMSNANFPLLFSLTAQQHMIFCCVFFGVKSKVLIELKREKIMNCFDKKVNNRK
jgi:hypothetical protein